jgi:hypothetical protein
MKNCCRHFTGVLNDTCQVGVRYDEVRVKPPDGMFKLPCFLDTDTCSKCSPYTDEEMAEHERERKAAFQGVMTARAAIVADGRKFGAIPCPVCDGGSLKFNVARNGHIHGKCSTNKCVAWME